MNKPYRLRTVTRDHAVRELQLQGDAPIVLVAEPGARYALIDAASGAPARGLTLKRDGLALVVEDGTGTVARVDGFYDGERAADAAFDVGAADASAAPVHITAADAAAEGSHVVWPAAGREAGSMAAADAAASASGGFGFGTGLAALGVIGIAAVASGGGGSDSGNNGGNTGGTTGGGTTGGTTGGGTTGGGTTGGGTTGGGTTGGGTTGGTTGGSASGFANAVSVSVVGGPVVASNDLQVAIYTADGRLLDIAKLDTQGHITMTIGEYRGVIIAKVAHDGDNVADYLDEATGAGKTLSVDLFAIGVIAGQNETLTLNLNLLTTLAYLKAITAAGVDPLAGHGTLDAATVTGVNQAVAVAFGLADLHAQAVVTVNGTTSYNAADGISSAEKYGEILAALSGSDVQHGGSTQETLDRLVAGVVVALAADGTPTAEVGSSASVLINSGAAVVDLATGGHILGSISGQTSPTVLGFALGASSGSSVGHAALAAGDTLTVTVAFSEAVSVDGRPQVVLDIGGTLVHAVYEGGSGTATLTFTYVLQAGQSDADGIAIPAGQLLLDGAGIRALDDGQNALAGHAGMVADANFTVDATVASDAGTGTGTGGGTGTGTGTGGDTGDTGTGTGTGTGGGIGGTGAGTGTGTGGGTGTGTGTGGDTGGTGTGTGTGTGGGTGGTGAGTGTGGDTGGAGTGSGTGVGTAGGTAGIAPPVGAVDDVGSVTGPLKSGDSTDDTSLLLTGSCQPGSTVQIYDGDTLVGTATLVTTADGTTWRYAAEIADGSTYHFRTVVTDAAGTTSAPSEAFTIVGDTSAPTTAPGGIALGHGTGGAAADLLTHDASQTVTATLSAALAAGEKLYGSVDGGATFVDITGFVTGTALVWEGVTLAPGSHTIEMRVVDAAGNAGPSSIQPYTLDTTAPTIGAMVVATDDVGAVTGPLASGSSTDDGAIDLTGTCEAGSTVAIYDGTVLIGTAVVSGTTWTYTASIADGTAYRFSAVATDAAGNASAPTEPFVIVGDASPPSATGIGTATDDVGFVTGPLASGASTDDTALALSGTCEAGATVRIYDGATFLGLATVTGTSWSYGAAVADGVTYAFHTTETDTAGNTSAPSAAFVVTGNTTAPTTTLGAVALSADAGASAADFVTNEASQTIRATLSAPLGADEKVYGSVDGGATFIDITSFVSGTSLAWSGATLAAGSHEIVLQVASAVTGNAGPAATAAYTLDTSAPALGFGGATDDVGPITGALASGGTTDDPSLLLSGTCEAGSTVAVYDGTTLVGMATVSGTTWSYAAAIANGTAYAFHAVATDAAGNASAPSAAFAVTGDTTPPATTLGALALSADAGVSASDFVTNQASQTITATLSAALGAGEKVYGSLDGGATFVDITSFVSGTSLAWNATLGTGPQVVVKVVDAAGNDGTATSHAYTLDSTAPVVGSAIVATDDAGSITGALVSGSRTDDTSLALSGTCEAGSTVAIYNGTTLVGTATVSGTSWSYNASVADGVTYSFHAAATDPAGNASAPSAALTIVGDTTLPTASAIGATDDAGSVTGALTSGAKTDDTSLALSGTCEAGSTVRIYDGSTLVGTATVSGTTWSYAATIANGTAYSFHTVETDSAGNASAPSANFSVTGDSAAPTASTIGATDDVGSVTGTLSSGAKTDDTSLALSGTCEVGSTVRIYDGSTLVGTATVSGTSWSYAATIANGTTYSFHTVETDSAGNASAPSANFSITGDSAAPTASTITATDDVGSVTGTLSSGARTDDTSLALTGTCEAGSTVKIYDGSTLVGTATVSGTTWSYAATIANGTTYSFHTIETDAAGNASAPSASFGVVGDSAAPTAGTIAATDDVGSVTGTLTSGARTDDTSLALTGTCEAGSMVKIYDGSTLVGTATVSGTTWSYAATIANGTTYSFHTLETDAAGNASAPSASFTVTGDTTAPTASAITATDDVGSITGALTSGARTDDTSLVLSGTCEAGSTVRIYNGSSTVGTATVSGTTWSYAATIANGTTYNFESVETDAAGNASAPSASFTVTGDATAPTASAITATDDVGSVTGALTSGARTDDTSLALSGTCEAGSTVKIYDGGTLVGTAIVSGTTWSYAATVANGTAYSFHTVETDAAGNASAPSASFSITGDTTAPTASTITATDDVGSITGALTSGARTDDTSLALSGTCEAGSMVRIYNGSTLVGTATVSGTTWSYAATIANGTTYSFHTVETDSAGNASAASASFSVTGDTTAPTASAVTATDDVGSITGALTSGARTDDTLLLLSGTCEAGSTVRIYDGGSTVGAATVSGTTWGYAATIANGTTYSFHSVETDSVGNASAPSASFAVTGDTTAPTASAITATDDAGFITGPLGDGDTTDDTALVLSGTCEAGSTVKIYDGSTLVGSATVSGTSWSYTATIADATTYSFHSVETDAAGNASAASASLGITGDTTAPTTTLSAIALGSDSGASGSDFITKEASQTISATLSATLDTGEKLYGSLDGGTTFIDITSFVTGTSLSWTGATLGAGPSIEFKVVDATGNAGTAASQAYTLDTTAPTAGAVTATDDAGTISGTLTSGDTTDDTSLVLSGTCEAGSTVEIYDGSSLLGLAVVSGTTWSYSATIADTTSYSFNSVETDAAGNASSPSASFAVTGDSTAPTASAITATDDAGFITGTLADGDTTDDTSLVLSGTCETGSTVKVYDGSTLLGSATVSGTTWSYSATIADATTYSFHSVETDAAGNISADGASFGVTCDTTAPTTTVGTIYIGGDVGASTSDYITNDPVQSIETALTAPLATGERLYGSVDGGATFTDITSLIYGLTTVSWPAVTLLVGSSSIVFQVVDATGTAGPAGTQAYVIDTTAPIATSLVATDNEGAITGALTSGDTTDDTLLVLSGTCAADAKIEVYDGSTLLGTAVVSGTTWSYDAQVADGTTYSFHIVEFDVAGNASAPSSNFAVTGDSTAPTAGAMTASDDFGSVTGTIASGDATDDPALELSGACEAGSTVKIYDGSTYLGTATVSGTTWSYSATILNGVNYAFASVETDAAGNASAATTSYYVFGDMTPPGVGLDTATDDEGSITGSLSSGDRTDDTNLVLAGTCEPDATVDIYDGTSFVGSATVSGGSWSYTATVADGVTYHFNAKATDAVGNESAATASFTVIGDTTPPTASGITATDDVGAVTGALNSGDLTDDTSLVLSGTCEAGSTVDVYDGGVMLGTANVSGTTWSYSATIANATAYSFHTIETDVAGNASNQSTSFSVGGDTVAPSASAIDAADDIGSVTGTLSDGARTDDTFLFFTGTCEADSTVKIYDGSTLLGSAVISGTSWSYNATIVDGTTYTFHAVETDLAGNTSSAGTSFGVTCDTTAPTASAVTATDNVGTVTGPLTHLDTTDDTSLALSGTCEAGSTVDVYDNGTLLGSATVSGATWSYTATVADGTTYSFHAVETDVAGNASAAGASFGVTGDTTAPSADVMTASGDASGTANVASDEPATIYLVNTSVTVGSEADITSAGGTLWNSLAVADNSSHGLSLAGLDAGTYKAYAVDAAGNFSSASSGTYTVTAAPADDHIVVFDLIDGVSSSHSGRTFDASVSYQIYVLVDSTSSTLHTTPQGTAASGATWGAWSGGANLGDDDQVIFVGSGAGIKGQRGNVVSELESGAGNIKLQSPSGTTGSGITVFHPAVGLHASSGLGVSLTRTVSDTGHTVKIIDGQAPAAFFAHSGRYLSNAYLTAMPGNVLQTQGLA